MPMAEINGQLVLGFLKYHTLVVVNKVTINYIHLYKILIYHCNATRSRSVSDSLQLHNRFHLVDWTWGNMLGMKKHLDQSV